MCLVCFEHSITTAPFNLTHILIYLQKIEEIVSANNGISNLFQIKRVHESKVTLTTAWPIFVRWVDNRPGMNADASVEISDEVPQTIQVIE